MIIRIFVYMPGLVFIIATALPLFRHEDWWIRIFDFPRAQIAAGCIIVLLLAVFFIGRKNAPDYILICLLFTSIAYQAYKMYPYTKLSSRELLASESSAREIKISVLVSNVYMKNRDSARFLEIVQIHKPDVICVLEPDKWWDEQLSELDSKYPNKEKHISGDTYGMIFYSGLETVSSEVRYIVEDHIPSVHSVLKLESGQLIEFYCLHPSPPNPKYAKDTEERDAELLIVGKEAKDSEHPVIVAGDLNDVAWSYTTNLFRKISGLLDPRIGRGFYNTFHAQYPVLRFPLDHFFVSESFRLERLERLRSVGSDHFPIYAEFSYEPEREYEQAEKKPHADSGDRELADEKIEEAEE